MDKQQSIGHRILHFPLVKIVVGFVICICMALAGSEISNRLLDHVLLPDDVARLISESTMAIFSLVSYIYLYKYYEKRKIEEVSLRNFGRNVGIGLLLGIGLQSLVILVIFLFGYMQFLSANPISWLLPALAISISSGILEEILFRGILFRITEEKLGSYISLFISGLLFGLLHITNKNSSLMMAMAIAIEAGLMLGAAYMCTRNLWLPIALHFGWNFAQGGIYGAAISGNELDKSLLNTQISGNELVTGGAFGPEGSLFAILFCVTTFIIMMVYNHRHHRIIAPFWVAPKG